MKYSTFGAFNYSSGESVSAQSDSQNVDYGVEACQTSSYFAAQKGADNSSGSLVFNNTPEVISNNFGVVSFPFGIDSTNKKNKAFLLAKPAKKGANKTVGPVRGAFSGGNNTVKTGMPTPRDALKSIVGAIDNQKETSIGRVYLGQLKG